MAKDVIVLWKCTCWDKAGKLDNCSSGTDSHLLRKNENYLARFIPFFETQVGMDLNAENMLTELVRDNR